MSVKHVCLATLVAALLGVSAVHGQYTPSTGSNDMTGPAAAPGTLPTQSGGPDVAPGPGEPGSCCLSNYIVGTKPCCCGPVGDCGPVQMETYLRSGISFPFSDGVFGHTLEAGWEIAGGGRSLFFNKEQDAAWVVDLGIENIHNHGRNPSFEAPLNHIFVPTSSTVNGSAGTAIVNFVPLPALHALQRQAAVRNHTLATFHPSNRPVEIRAANTTTGTPQIIAAEGVSIADLNRTFVSAGGGREWYLYGGPHACNGNCGDQCGQLTWRAGFDLGGRYGSAKLELHEIRHRTTTISGLYAALYSDLEYPCGCCTFFAGGRLEFDYTWMQILQAQNDTSLEGINLLFTVGSRF